MRLSKYGHRVGLINDERMAKVELKEKQIAEEVERVKSVNIGTGKEVLDLLEKYGSTELKTGVTLAELVKRPELNYEILAPIDKHRPELASVSYTHLRAHETDSYLVCRLLLEKKKKTK